MTEYKIDIKLERPQEIYFAMNAIRQIVYGEPCAVPLGKIEQIQIQNHSLIKDEKSRENYFYIQSLSELPNKLEDTLDTKLQEFSICSPNFSKNETDRREQQKGIVEILKAEGTWTLGTDYQILRLKWYE